MTNRFCVMHFRFHIICGFIIFLCILTYLLLPKPPLLEGLSSSQVVYSRDHRVLRLTLSADDKYRVVLSRAQVSKAFVDAIFLKEDQLFYWHAGVNPWAIVRAAFATYVLHHSRQGGSTITMQVARLRYGLSTRTLGGKMQQIIRAIELERHYSKEDILTAYLSLIPYGRNIEGVGAASLVYFNKDPSALNLAEALTLAVIPQSPGSRDLNRESTQAALLKSRADLFEAWLKKHPEDQKKKTVLDLPIHALTIKDLPFRAPHFVDEVLSKNPDTNILVTSLNLDKQHLLERHIKDYVRSRQGAGVNNATALLVNVNTLEVEALVGSADFFDAAIQGQVNGVAARRSPGSALKPFVYALAIDQGLIHPQSLLKDTPSHFGGGYDPENFEHDFLGPLTAYDALIKSRNIPALALTAQLKKPDLYEFFQRAGIQNMQTRDFYGLALSLGGVEVTMEEMVMLYAMLANGGELKSLQAILNGPKSQSDEVFKFSNVLSSKPRHSDTQTLQHILSPEAAFLTLDILKDNPRPGSFAYTDRKKKFPIAWKTGTSYSYRDAWTVGVFGPYVLCVWVGNFDGKGNPAFVGRQAAAPLFFSIAEDLKIHYPWTKDFTVFVGNNNVRSLNVKKVDVCSVSGDLPGKFCPHTKTTWFIPGKSPIKTCSLHRDVAIDAKTGLRLCPGVAGNGNPDSSDPVGNENDRSSIIHKVYEFWPTDLLALFKQAGLKRQSPPPFAPECSLNARASQGKPPEIISPLGAVVYSLQLKKIPTETIAFRASADSDATELNWFVDDAFVGRVSAGETFFWPAKAGVFTVRVVDDEGRAAVQKLVVKMVP